MTMMHKYLFTLFALPAVATAATCIEASDCSGCLSNSDCHWSGGSCGDTCKLDVSCYSPKSFIGNTTAEICQKAADDIADRKLCNSKSACGNCTTTELTNGQTCIWYSKAKHGFDLCSSGSGDETWALGPRGDSKCDFVVTATLSCQHVKSCESCLQNPVCKWTYNHCDEACMSEETCYATEFFPKKSVAEICEAAATAQADKDLCGAQNSCHNCTSAIKSDGKSCMWFSPDNNKLVKTPFCAQGCGMIGCGSTENCQSPTDPPVVDCESVTTCGECILRNQCKWSYNKCRSHCLSEDTCYAKEYFPKQTVDEICAAAATAQANKDMCASKESCGDCTSATQSDGRPCMWFSPQTNSSTGRCARGCQFRLCGITDNCPAEKSKCSSGDADSCSSCLSKGDHCKWSVGSCYEECATDVTCYRTSNATTVEEVCAREANDRTDIELCSSKKTCDDCTSAKKTDEEPCMWFSPENNNATKESFCSPGCGMIGCGTTTKCPTSGSPCTGLFCGVGNGSSSK